jgi:glycosyltransferase involved in cell wall biosynthesis
MPSSTPPTISVIMPCYNRSDTIGRSIDSVLAQSFANWELVIIDDGSTDCSRDIINAYHDPRVTSLFQLNQGVCSARNAGLKQAKGELIAFLDADDTWHHDCLNKLYQAITTNDAGLVYCGWQNIGLSGGQGEPFIPPDYETPDKMAMLFESCRWPIHACLTYKTVITEAGMFNETLQTAEDYLLWLNIAMQHSLACVPEVLAYYHFHNGNQATNDRAKTAINHYRAQQLFLAQQPSIATSLGRARLKQLMFGPLLNRGFECYWNRELVSSRRIFRLIMSHGYGSAKDWLYMLPSLLPYWLHLKLLAARDERS